MITRRGGYSDPRSCYCTPASATEENCLKKEKKKALRNVGIEMKFLNTIKGILKKENTDSRLHKCVIKKLMQQKQKSTNGIKLNSFSTAKETINKVNRQTHRVEENICMPYI